MDKLNAFLQEDHEYFQSCKNRITMQNNTMLLDGCVVYAGVLLFYTVLTALTAQPQVLRTMYYVFDVIHLFLCIAVFTRSKKIKQSYRATQLYSAALELTLLGFFALEGVYTSKTQHSLYIPIAILLVLLLFIHPAMYTNLITLLYLSVFIVLSCLYKTPEAYTNDIYIAIAAFLAANIGYVLIARIRHREAAALQKYEILSKRDLLTGLLNKSAIEAACIESIAKPEQCALIIIDLDNFKNVNDVYGHAVGDEVLQKVGTALKKSFRGTEDWIGRFGGDEFIVLMNECSDKNIITGRMKAIIREISQLQFSTDGLRVQCSAGVTVKRAADSLNAMFNRADSALYKAKTEGKGRYCIDEETGTASPDSNDTRITSRRGSKKDIPQ